MWWWAAIGWLRRSLRALGSAIEGTANQDGPALAPTNSGIREIDQLAHKFNAMQEANQTMEQRIRDMAFHDPLTGLANRRLLVDRLEQTLARNHRGGEFAALLFFDLDNFKTLNDTHGHGAGDVLLEEVAVRLQGQVRETDTVARFGGDEFVVLLTRLGSEPVQAFEQASALAETLRDALSRPYELATGREGEPTVQHVCTASVGVAVFSTGASEQVIASSASVRRGRFVRCFQGGLKTARRRRPWSPRLRWSS